MLRSRHSVADCSEPVLEACGVTKKFPIPRGWIDAARDRHAAHYVTALDEVTFRVAEGQFFGLLGPSGAGKTTLFKILCTIIEPDHGSARVAGYDLRTQPERVRSVVTRVDANDRRLNWRISAAENLRFYASLYGLKGWLRQNRIAELLELVELENTERSLVGAFSSAMRLRLLLARALLTRPRLLLLDEPTRSLGEMAAHDFRILLRETVAVEHDSTVLLATRSSEEALDLCDCVGVMKEGRMIMVGPPGEIVQHGSGLHYRVWTRMPAHPAFRLLENHPGVSRVIHLFDEGDYGVVELKLLENGDKPAEVLDVLIQSGVRIKRFERVQLPLPKLIEDMALGPYDAPAVSI